MLTGFKKGIRCILGINTPDAFYFAAENKG